jgi:nicotinamide-nucleotide amidase
MVCSDALHAKQSRISMNASILSIGDELVLGQIVDTNSAWLSRRLAEAGINVTAHLTVGDDRIATADAIRSLALRSDMVLVTGGIGPTADDLTRFALADVLGSPLELHDDWVQHIRAFFKRLGREMPQSNEVQAMIPRGATLLWNDHGTAAGIRGIVEVEGRSVAVFVMPGVPKEMFAMHDRFVAPEVARQASGAAVRCRVLHTFGAGESALAEKLGSLMDRTRNPTVGTTASGGVVSIRIYSRFESAQVAQRELDATEAACRAAVGDLIYGSDGDTLASVVGGLLSAGIDDEPLTVAVAESCTGGLLARYLTDVPGSSAYFVQGWVCYSNLSKTMLLDVPPTLIAARGAVSEQVVEALASRALELAGVDYALAISGVAGPDGGTPEKPVGTVCIALACRLGALSASKVVTEQHDPSIYSTGHAISVASRRFLFPGDREMVRDRAAKMALTMLRMSLLGRPMPF